MSDILFKLLNEDNYGGNCLFNRFKNRLFKDYAQGNKFIKKNDLWIPLNEITKELYGAKLDKEGFNNIYSELDINDKGFITKKQFGTVAKCLIMSLITYFERKYPIPGREISLCLEDSDLPVQMEIVDTLSEDEIRQLKNNKKPRYNNNSRKKRRNKRKRNMNTNIYENNLNKQNIICEDNIITNIIHKTKKIEDLLIDIDSEDC